MDSVRDDLDVTTAPGSHHHPVLWGLLLSSLAGGSTTIGGLIGVWRRPNDSTLAFLLGVAIGVMMLLAVVEMWVHNALEHGVLVVTVGFVAGAGLYRLLQVRVEDCRLRRAQTSGHSSTIWPAASLAVLPPYYARHFSLKSQPLLPDSGTCVVEAKNSGNLEGDGTKEAKEARSTPAKDLKQSTRSSNKKARSAELFRLGLLMSVTMTLHNLPEGFAVAFSSLTDFGPVMALAIAIHNIPEGIIVAAPVYAATGSRWKALGMAAASGLSEPIGALIALLSVKPVISEESLHVILAVVGGIMAAVCVLELLPEAKKCNDDRKLALGVVCGAVIMGSTLLVGV